MTSRMPGILRYSLTEANFPAECTAAGCGQRDFVETERFLLLRPPIATPDSNLTCAGTVEEEPFTSTCTITPRRRCVPLGRPQRHIVKQVFIARHPAEGHFVKGLLESEGIQAIVRGEELSGVRGGVPVTLDTSPSVWVFEDSQIEGATVIIKRYDSGTTVGGGTALAWRCPQCGEHVEGQFTACWKCGTDRVDNQ